MFFPIMSNPSSTLFISHVIVCFSVLIYTHGESIIWLDKDLLTFFLNENKNKRNEKIHKNL
jgi:hypothetical protein